MNNEDSLLVETFEVLNERVNTLGIDLLGSLKYNLLEFYESHKHCGEDGAPTGENFLEALKISSIYFPRYHTDVKFLNDLSNYMHDTFDSKDGDDFKDNVLDVYGFLENNYEDLQAL